MVPDCLIKMSVENLSSPAIIRNLLCVFRRLGISRKGVDHSTDSTIFYAKLQNLLRPQRLLKIHALQSSYQCETESSLQSFPRSAKRKEPFPGSSAYDVK